MKKSKYIFFLISILVIISLIIKWYGDQIFYNIQFFYYILEILIIFFHFYILELIRKTKIKKQKIGIIILILNIFVFIFFPFRFMKAKYDTYIYEKDKLQIVELVKTNYIKPNNVGIAKLPNKYKNLSLGNEIMIFYNQKNEVVVGFFVFRGIMSGSCFIVYTDGEKNLLEKNIDYLQKMEKIKDNWYFVITE